MSLPFMASVRTRDKDSICYSTQNVWACYSLTIPKPQIYDARHTRKRTQPQLADKVIALQHITDISSGAWETTGYWGRYARGPDVLKKYAYETKGFSILMAKAAAQKNWPWDINEDETTGSRKNINEMKADYRELVQYVTKRSGLINFATHEGAKKFCEGEGYYLGADPARVSTCEVDYTYTLPRETWPDKKTGDRFYPKGAKYGCKIIVGTWIDDEGDLRVRWAESHPVYSDPRAFSLIASG